MQKYHHEPSTKVSDIRSIFGRPGLYFLDYTRTPLTMPRVAFYTRVSTVDQTTINQTLELERWAAARGHEITARYEDAGISGSKDRTGRPGLDAMLRDAVRRKFDVVAVWSVDRLSRSHRDLINSVGDLKAAGVDLVILQSGLDTSTPSGEALFGMMSIFAQLERSMARERTVSGIARARQKASA